MNNYFDVVLHHYGREKIHPDISIIGAMDGVSFDDMRGYINMYGWGGILLVEPIPEMYERLIKSYDVKLNNKYENSAIVDVEGTVEMIRIPPDIVDSKLVHECFNGMSAIYPPRNGLGSEGDKETVEKYAERINVNGITLETLFKKHEIVNIDIISIDAEGCDWDIIKQFDFNKYRPKLIRCEYINLSEVDQLNVKRVFAENGYLFNVTGQNIDAVDKRFWNKIKTPTNEPIPILVSPVVNVNQPKKKENVDKMTIVTGLFDLGRGDIDAGFSRSFDHYIESFKKLLDVDLPFVIYTTNEIANEVVWKIRKHNNTRVIIKTLDTITEDFPFKNEVEKIRNTEKWKKQEGWLYNSPQSTLEMYNPVVMSKQFWLNDAAIFDYFNTEYFLWVDAGISNTIGNPSEQIHKSFADKITQEMNKMLYVCFPYDGQSEVHGFRKDKMNLYAGTDTKYVARGGIFGGSKYYINEINSHYYSTLSKSLNEGYMGTEESIFTILTYTHRHLTKTHMIDSNGLVIKFLNDINTLPDVDNDTNKLAIYVLTYNLPKQFKLWINSFFEAYPDDYKNVQKYVINNSTDENVDDEYTKLFRVHGFKEFKFDNIGINDGRQFAAEHFNDSAHEYMIFFEDDMLLHTENKICKNGFNTYTPNLFTKSINIMEIEELDYLKLCFSEFFGDNHDDWASHNVNEQVTKERFPYRDDGVSHRKTKIDYTGVYDRLSYSVGNYHYCNWPLLFNKRGNEKVFLHKVLTHKYEQQWMANVSDTQWNDDIKCGCLLASMINHNRVFHYGKDNRRENKHYTN